MAVDFALVCATHRALAHDGPDAPVRPDLYFRIAEYTVTLAPLRARPDLRELLRTLWAAQGSGPVLPSGIEDALAHYAWPGNYRQMVAVLRTLHVLAGASGRVDEEMLPAEIRGVPMAQAPATLAGAASLQAWEAQEALLKHQIQQRMGSASYANFPGGSVSWKRSKDGKAFNTAAFEKDHPDLAKAYTSAKAGSRRFLLQELG